MALDIQDAPAQEGGGCSDAGARWDRVHRMAEREGVKVISGVYVRNLRTAEVGDWPRKGVKGAIVYLDGDDQWDSQVLEIPPGGATITERHLYDEAIHVVSGRGAARVWFDDNTKQTFEWGEGSFFVLPTNATSSISTAAAPSRRDSLGDQPAGACCVSSTTIDFIFNYPLRSRIGSAATRLLQRRGQAVAWPHLGDDF